MIKYLENRAERRFRCTLRERNTLHWCVHDSVCHTNACCSRVSTHVQTIAGGLLSLILPSYTYFLIIQLDSKSCCNYYVVSVSENEFSSISSTFKDKLLSFHIVNSCSPHLQSSHVLLFNHALSFSVFGAYFKMFVCFVFITSAQLLVFYIIDVFVFQWNAQNPLERPYPCVLQCSIIILLNVKASAFKTFLPMIIPWTVLLVRQVSSK